MCNPETISCRRGGPSWVAPLELASPEAAVVEQVDRGTGQLLREQGRNARVDVDEAAGGIC